MKNYDPIEYNSNGPGWSWAGDHIMRACDDGQWVRREDAEPSNWVHRMVRQLEAALATAKDKEYLVDLTKDESAAICFFAGVGYVVTLEGLTFEPCSLAKRDGKWTAYVRGHA